MLHFQVLVEQLKQRDSLHISFKLRGLETQNTGLEIQRLLYPHRFPLCTLKWGDDPVYYFPSFYFMKE